jgi:CRISPR-associated exonuclease Cas4
VTTDSRGQAGDQSGLAQVPLSALEHHDYCPRQAALILLEDGYADDASTLRGVVLHQRVHEPSEETRAGIRTLRALPVWNDALGLTGVCDVVEIYDDGRIIPVEHKSGDYQPGGPADVQLAGQAMCLEEMFKTRIAEGAIFSASDRRRHRIALSPELRDRVTSTAMKVQAILGQERLPPALSDKRCRRCSMNHVCLPKVLAAQRAFTRAQVALFEISPGTDATWDD